MDKSQKLQRYSHKDYSELVDFPVEIVGRDGVIRRYTFEDSIRLYQRRITFAPIRYRDRELIDAEVDHCRHRIDQLRRSFFYRFGWGTPDGAPDPEDVFGDLAGELAAFLRRVLRCEGRPDVVLELLEEDSDGVSTWHLLPRRSQVGMLLYLHRFDEEDREPGRDRFFAVLKTLERNEKVDQGERLLAFHHTADCGFILSGQAGQFDALASLSQDDGVIRDISPTRWDRLVDQVRLGQYQDALSTAQLLTREQPHHRRAYVVGAVLASFLGEPVDAEELALIGSLYFPGDPDLAYLAGVARWRQGRLVEASEALSGALERRPESGVARFLAVVVLFDRGQWLDARRVLVARSTQPCDDRRSERLLDGLARAARMFVLAIAAALVLIVAGMALVPLVGVFGLAPTVLGGLFGVLAVLAMRHELHRLIGRQRFDDVPVWTRRATRQEPRSSDPA